MKGYYKQIIEQEENGTYVVIPESIIEKDLLDLREARSHTSVNYDLK